jgi:protein-disulfide isomerase
MKRTLLLTTLGLAVLTGCTEVKKEDIGPIAAEYLADNPEFLIEASKKLQQMEQDKAQSAQVEKIVTHQAELLDETTPYIGNADASVVVVEFSDYRCGFCKRMAPVVEDLVKADPDIQFRFKETPILGQASQLPAQLGLAVFKQKGALAYADYHHQAFNASTPEALKALADKLEINQDSLDAWQASLQSNVQLFSQLGIQRHAGVYRHAGRRR